MNRRVSAFHNLDEISASIEGTHIDPSSVPKILYGHRGSIDESTGDLSSYLEARVLVLYTGGTIGMVSNDDGQLCPLPHALESRIRLYPHMHDAAYAAKKFHNTPNVPLVLPASKDKDRIAYWVYEYNPLLDSSNMTMDDWVRIAIDIKKVYDHFDGFVVLHGTDTLAYTASALSFMMEHLGKPIILTGSQIPIFETRSDGRDNFIGSVILASSYNVPEVSVYFDNKLYRGNRTVKTSSGSLAAFGSPNMPPLAVAGINIHVDTRLIFRWATLSKFEVQGVLNRHVVLLRIFPSISTETVRGFLLPPTSGVVLQTYGAGNIPSNRPDFIQVLSDANDRGVIIVNITQCAHGSVEALYETGQVLREAGVLPGHDMTPEAAVTKLSYVLAKDEWDLATKKRMMVKNLRGELTILHEEEQSISSSGIIETVTRVLQLSSSAEVDQVKEIIIPTLFYGAVQNGDIERMDTLLPQFHDINYFDVGGYTALHIAAKEGNVDVVRWLLENGASVHIRNGDGLTPLWLAVDKCNDEVIKLLVQTGATVFQSSLVIGQYLVNAAAVGNLSKLRCFSMAGCDMNATDALGRTALHAACTVGSSECVQFLLTCKIDTTIKDKTNQTAEMCAEIGGFHTLMDVIRSLKKGTPTSSPRLLLEVPNAD